MCWELKILGLRVLEGLRIMVMMVIINVAFLASASLHLMSVDLLNEIVCLYANVRPHKFVAFPVKLMWVIFFKMKRITVVINFNYLA